MLNTTFMKYFFVLIILSVLFSGLSSPVTEPISFRFITGIQTLYVVMFLFQLIYDSNIGLRAFTITIPKTRYTSEDTFHFPLVWIILPGLILQLISSVFMTILSNYMHKNYGQIKLAYNDRWKLMMYKWMFVVATFSLMMLTYSYCVDFTPITPLSGMYKTWLLFMTILSIFFPIFNVFISEKLCSYTYKTTQ